MPLSPDITRPLPAPASGRVFLGLRRAPYALHPARMIIRRLRPALLAIIGFMAGSLGATDIGTVLAEHARPFRATDDLPALADRMGRARVVLLGEASHGTHEFYATRAGLTRALVANHGFRIVAVEGDWAPLYRLNNYIKHVPGSGESAVSVLEGLTRWPQWMWANHETAELAEWLRDFNADRPAADQVGFYGIDTYAPWDAAALVLDYLREHRPADLPAAESAYAPLLDPDSPSQSFIRASILGTESQRAAVLAVAASLRGNPAEAVSGTSGWFAAMQAAKVVLRTKTHFHTSQNRGTESWNIRALHMHETLLRLLAVRGEQTKAIVWAHNTHIGDARATAMAGAGMVNIGATARHHFGRDAVFSLGFATHTGEVLAGRAWEASRETMIIPPAGPLTLEGKLAGIGRGDVWLDLSSPALAKSVLASQAIPHRAIGVVYQPEMDARQNFVPSILPARYDALVFIENTTPLRALVP